MKTLDDLFENLEENRNAESVVTANGMTLLMKRHLEETILENTKKELPVALFSKVWKLEELRDTMKALTVIEEGIYKGTLEGAGYEFVKSRTEIVPMKKRIGVTEGKELIEGITRRTIELPMDLDKFKVNEISIKVRKIGLGEALTDFTGYEESANNGKLFIVEEITIGKHVKKWNDDLYFVKLKK
jgi:hypothetical protein